MAEEEQDDRNELRDFLISRGHSAEKVNRALESYKRRNLPRCLL